MKKFFVNPDGTIKIPITTGVVCLITFLLILVIISLSVARGDLVLNDETTTTQTETTKINLCKDCSLSFDRESLTIASNYSFDISEVLKVKNMSLYDVKFKDYDDSIISIEKSKMKIKSKDKLGSTKITAYYEDVSATMEIVVSQNYINDASFKNDINYIYLDKANKIDFNLSPEGISSLLLNLKSEDESICKFDDNNNLVGVSTGETYIDLTVGEEVKKTLVYVIKNKITINIKDNGIYKENYSYDFKSNIDNYLEISVKAEDNDKVGYTNDSLKVDIVNSGSLKTTYEYLGPSSADPSLYLYKLSIKYNIQEQQEDNSSILYFSLPDGSKSRLVIVKK